MTTMQVTRSHSAAVAAGPAPGPPATLAREHTRLMGQIAVRAGHVLTATADGRWPAAELRALAGYLRAELLRQAEDEEWLLFPPRHASAAVARLVRDHVCLRFHVEALERAADGAGASSRSEVAALTGTLLAQLHRHMAAEEAVLAAARSPGEVSATTSPGTRQHRWYPLTEGPVVNLDALPADERTDAAVDRLRRLRAGEQVELRSSRDTAEIWQRMDRAEPGGYGFYCMLDGPAEWHLRVTRRPSAGAR